MANNNKYTWDFSTINVYPSQGGNADVVCNVHWRLKACDSTERFCIERFGSIDLPAYNPTSGSFIPFSQLTKDDITNWVLSSMGNGYGEMTASMDLVIQDAMNPTSVPLDPPWNTPTPSPTYVPMATPTMAYMYVTPTPSA